MQEILHLINEMSPYLLLGFLLAGVMHAFLPSNYYGRFLGGRRFGSVVNAALFGIPLPLCSCGVIPTAMSLRKEGASRGATVSFLIATPQTGVDSIVATFSLMGLPFAVVRPLAALATALVGGSLANVADRDDAPAACRCSASSEAPRGFWSRCVEALRYAYVEMMQDIGKWLVVGLLIAGLITIFVPDSWFTLLRGNSLASMLLVLLMAMPMYVCATGSIPIAVALMLKGLTPGAALVLLMAGPACNFASMIVVRKVLGLRTTLVYMLSIVLGAVGFGLVVDFLQASGRVNFLGHLLQEHACCGAGDSWFAWTASVALLLLLVNALLLRHRSQKNTTSTPNDMSTQVYHVEGIDCNHCRQSAEKALQSVEGVTSASVDLATKEARVEGTASREALAKALSDIGFELR